MKKTIFLLVFIVFVLAAYFLAAFKLNLLTITVIHRDCENGYYATYPKGITDVTETYYDSSSTKVGECKSFLAGPTCESAQNLAGTCDKEGYTDTEYTPGRLLNWLLAYFNLFKTQS